MKVFWLDFNLAFRNIVRQKRRSAIAVGAVAFGITGAHSGEWFYRMDFLDFRESTIKSQLGHLQIVRPGYHEAGKARSLCLSVAGAIPELEAQMNHSKSKLLLPGSPLAA